MKKLFLLAPLVLFLVFTGCKKIDQLLTFNVNVSQSVTIPAALAGVQLPPVTVVTKSEESFRNNKTTRDKVKNVRLDQLLLTVTSPADATFDFLEKIDVYIQTPNGNNKILLARLDPVPRGANSIKLEPTTAKLDEYLKSDTYELIVDAKVTGLNPNSYTIRCDSRFKVTADPL